MGQACSSSPSLVVPACPKRGGTVVVLRFGGACESPLYGIRRCMSHTRLGRFSMLDVSTVGIVSVPNRSVLETSRRELLEDVSFGVGTLLVVEQSSLDQPPQGGVICTVVYGVLCCAGHAAPRFLWYWCSQN